MNLFFFVQLQGNQKQKLPKSGGNYEGKKREKVRKKTTAKRV